MAEHTLASGNKNKGNEADDDTHRLKLGAFCLACCDIARKVLAVMSEQIVVRVLKSGLHSRDGIRFIGNSSEDSPCTRILQPIYPD